MNESSVLEAHTVVHRVGGGHLANLRLSALDKQQTPPGISLLAGETPQEAAQQMCRAFPRSKKWQKGTQLVGSTTVAAIRQAGFDVLLDPTSRFPNHVRLIHPDGLLGFTDDNLAKLAQFFKDTTGC